MIRDAVKDLGGRATIPMLEKYFAKNHPDINKVNIRYDATMITVNAPSRIHYGGGKQIRLTNTRNQYDCLFKSADGYYEIYDIKRHGVWEIYKTDNEKLAIRRVSDEGSSYEYDTAYLADDLAFDADIKTQENIDYQGSKFALESHLRDYLAKNISTIYGLPGNIKLFKDRNGDGIEYRTDVGVIDVLAIDDKKCLYVFELKLGRGSDAAVGQVLRYMGWLKENVSDISEVYGVLMAADLSDNLRYAASMAQNILLFEYQMQFTVKAIGKIS